jgi:hypothetical protein
MMQIEDQQLIHGQENLEQKFQIKLQVEVDMISPDGQELQQFQLMM